MTFRRVTGRIAFSLALLAAFLCSCRSSGAPEARDGATSTESAVPSAPATAPTAAASSWVLEAPQFDPFLQGLQPACSRSVRIDKWRDKWMKSYDVRVPSVAVEVLDAHFRARAKELGLEVLKPLAADLVAGKDGTATSAGLSVLGAMVTVTTDLTKPDLDAELRRAANGAPKELFDLVAALGGAGAITRLVTNEGAELGRDVDMTLSRGGSVSDAAIADAAEKIGLVAKSEAAFGSPNDPAPGSWYIGFGVDPKEITINAANPSKTKSKACEDHPSRHPPDDDRPKTPEDEKRKKADEEKLLEEMMGP